MPIDASVLANAIRNKIPITYLEVEDQSTGCGESYAVVIVSEVFKGKTTLARHRYVNEILKDLIAQLHAFSQKTYTPDQYANLVKST
ncbi:bola protein [Amanita rubescens]|nr:bola protein [Amanita rubescens]